MVFTVAEDGIVLEGAVFAPAGGQGSSVPIVWMHGLASHFYTPPVITLGRHVAGRGHTFIAANNRGHDLGAVLYTPQGKIVLGGGGWEAFDACPRDIAAWVAFAAKVGQGSVVLAGHSLGALKVGYYLGLRQDTRVIGLVAASAPCNAHHHKPESVSLAEAIVAEGRGRELLPLGASQAGVGTISAQTLLNRVQTETDAWSDEREAV